MRISHQAIYQALFVQGRGALNRELVACLRTHSPQCLLAVENELNQRPRIVLEDRPPAELFEALLASHNQSVLRR